MKSCECGTEYTLRAAVDDLWHRSYGSDYNPVVSASRSGSRIVSLHEFGEALMDTLTSTPVLLVQAEVFKRILRRSVRAVASGADHAGNYKHHHPQNLHISRAKEAAKSAQHSPFLELISVLEGVRFELSSGLWKKVGWLSLNTKPPCAIEANYGECDSERVDSFPIYRQRSSRTKLSDKKEGANSCTDDHSETRTEDAKDAGEQGTSGYEEHVMSGEELRAKSEKKGRSKSVGRGGTSEVLCPSEEQTTEDEKFMLEALLEAKMAASMGEVPVGAVVVQKGRIIARAYNRVEAEGDPTAHAEILCIRSASEATGDWRLNHATIYVTMEPCPMCAGALLQARVKRVVWGARNNLLGADGSWVSLFPNSEPNHSLEEGARPVQHPFHKTLEVRREIFPNDCSMIMRTFFRSRRKGEVLAAKRKPWWLSFEFWVLFRKLMVIRNVQCRS